MSYKVKLELFEGPLDLLLYLIKKNEIDIAHIPIAEITQQYLEYLEIMRLLDLNIAGEFIVMAATLMHIKSRLLLPPEELPPEEEEEDPQEQLIQRLLEYKKFKEAAMQLSQLELKQKDIFTRTTSEINKLGSGDGPYFEASLFDLITAFTKVLKEVPKESFYEVIKDEFTVEDKMHDIFHLLVEQPVIYFTKLFEKAKNKLEIIAIFLALLELIRLKELVIYQKSLFGEIEISRNPAHITPRPREAPLRPGQVDIGE